MGGILGDNLVARVIASQKLPRDSGESKRALRDINLSRRALWVGFEERNLGRPGNFAGMSRTPGGVQKVCAKKVCVHFSFPTWARGLRDQKSQNGCCRPRNPSYPLIQNDYRQEKIIFELFSGALQENPVRAPGAITGGALTGQGPIQETVFGELFSGVYRKIL